jgi:hypothetical protein
VILLYPTIKTLQTLARYDSVDAALANARSERALPAAAPRAAASRSGPTILFWGDYAYAEVGKLDPDGTGKASCEIVRASASPPRSGSQHRIRHDDRPGNDTYPLGDATTGTALIIPGPKPYRCDRGSGSIC